MTAVVSTSGPERLGGATSRRLQGVRGLSGSREPAARGVVSRGMGGPGGVLLVALALVGCATGLIAGVRSGPLWLDETISVNIARLPLFSLGPDSLYGGLRQDGAPPLYYLLLRAWTELFGTSTTAVRLLSVVLTGLALLLAASVGHRLAGRAGGRAAVVVLAALPWTMRFGSETRMYELVVVLVLAGAAALLSLPSRRAIVVLSLSAAALLYTHYWSLFLLAAVGGLAVGCAVLGLVRDTGRVRGGPRRWARSAPWQVLLALAGAGVLFVPWLPTFALQAAHTGAPWAYPVTLLELLRTPRYWGGGSAGARTLFGTLLLLLLTLAVLRRRVARSVAGVTAVTLLLAFTSVYVGGGAYTDRYIAVVVPLVALLAAGGAVLLPRGWPLAALTLVLVIGVVNGVPMAAASRTPAAGVAAQYRAAAGPGELLAYCPDQLGPDVSRLLGPDVPQLVYPSLAAPQRIDWVDYAQRQAAADPAALARALSTRAGDRPMFVLAENGYRTFGAQCSVLLRTLGELRGRPELLTGPAARSLSTLWRFGPPAG